MKDECLPMGEVPGTSALFRAFLASLSEPKGDAAASAGAIGQWYAANPQRSGWHDGAPEFSDEHRERLAELLLRDADRFMAGEASRASIRKLRDGAAAVVTGQQVGLFGGPLLTLLKAATAVARAREATAASGREHVPVFWLASEDHDFTEVNQVSLLTRHAVETRGTELHAGRGPVGRVPLGEAAEPLLQWAEELLGHAPVCEWLRTAYAVSPGYDPTFASAFGRLLAKVFEREGLVVMDAAARGFHALGAGVLRYAVEHAEELERRLMKRSDELISAGFHAQVLVAEDHSLLFLISGDGRGGEVREALRRQRDERGQELWRAGAKSFTTVELLAILRDEPERLSPNALLRPVFQDAILPTAAYVGGPAEVAYFAQCELVYRAALRRVTPVLPRLSATLIGPVTAKLLARDEVEVPQVWAAKSAEELGLRLGARAMPIEGKRKVAAAGNAMDAELGALVEYLGSLSDDLGRAAGVSASKMRYQMNRLRRISARFETERNASLKTHAESLVLHLYPEAHLPERLIAGVWYLAQFGEGLPVRLVEAAGQGCEGHLLLWL